MTLTRFAAVPAPRGHDHDTMRQAAEKQRPGGATPGPLSDHRSSPTIAGSRVSAGYDNPPPRVHDVTVLPAGTHRVRVPHGLLQSRRHSASAIFTYAVTDLVAAGRTPAPRQAAPGCHPGVRESDPAGGRETHKARQWLARRVGLSVSGLDEALAALGRHHHGDGLGERHPAYLTTRRHGRRDGGTIAVRTLAACDRYTQVPAWTLGDANGPLVDPVAWRLYVAAVKHRQDGVCRLPAGQLAGVIRVRRQAIPALLERLSVAGLVVFVAAPGKPTLILPLMVQLAAPEDRAALAAELAARSGLADTLATACGYLPAGWRPGWASDGNRVGPAPAIGGGPLFAISRGTHLLGTTFIDTARGGPPDRPLLADPFPAAAPGGGLPPMYRAVRDQIYARRAAQRAAVAHTRGTRRAPPHPPAGLAPTG